MYPKLFLNKSFKEIRINLENSFLKFQAKCSGTVLNILKWALLKAFS